jgi:hypothetical protein
MGRSKNQSEDKREEKSLRFMQKGRGINGRGLRELEMSGRAIFWSVGVGMGAGIF